MVFLHCKQTVQILILGVMREFLVNAIGYATIAAFVFTVIYTWGETNKMLKEIEKQNNAL